MRTRLHRLMEFGVDEQGRDMVAPPELLLYQACQLWGVPPSVARRESMLDFYTGRICRDVLAQHSKE